MTIYIVTTEYQGEFIVMSAFYTYMDALKYANLLGGCKILATQLSDYQTAVS